jgi:protein ImuB
VRARLCEAHLPGARFVWEPLETVPLRSVPRVVAPRPLVRRIFEQPAPVRLKTDTTAAGPYLLSGAWWGSRAVERDYYFVRTGGGDTLWIYYDRQRERFFLQGQVE